MRIFKKRNSESFGFPEKFLCMWKGCITTKCCGFNFFEIIPVYVFKKALKLGIGIFVKIVQ